MCPWAFSTQAESHRRAHTDNGAARHGFWKVTLRIAFNTLKKDSLSSEEHTLKCACKQMDTQEHALIHGHWGLPEHSTVKHRDMCVPLADSQSIQLCSAKRTAN